MKIILLCLFYLKLISAEPTPIVLWHGMGDTCCSGYSLGKVKYYLQDLIPGVYVLSLRIGNSTIQDLDSGYFVHPKEQIDFACKVISEDEKLKNGFNAIGFSQGAQFLRGLLQLCGHKLPPMKVLISMGGQHQGVYGLPHCGVLEKTMCNEIRYLLNHVAYSSFLQNELVQATYWHDPLNEVMYSQGSTFIGVINNELIVNKTYINNLMSLDKFVMVKFEKDSMVVPPESSWFGFYTPGQAAEIQPLNKSAIYLKDTLGLRAMDKAGKLEFLSCPGDHLHFTDSWFTKNILRPYLLN